MGKATAFPRRSCAASTLRGSARALPRLIRPPTRTCSVEHAVPALPRSEAIDPLLSARAGRGRRSRRDGRRRVHRTRAAPLASVALGGARRRPARRGSRRSRMGERWRVDLEGDGVAAARIAELVDASIESCAPRRRRARLSHVGRPRPLSRRSAPPRRVRDVAALARRRGREPHARRRPTGARVCWVAAPIFCPGDRARRAELPTEWLPHALVLVGRPDPEYVGRERPARPSRPRR